MENVYFRCAYILIGDLSNMLAKVLKRVRLLHLLYSIISSIEIIQFIFYVGIFDIDDIILNSLGCIRGFTFYKIIKWIFGEQKGWFYIH